jgi:hypothetical protein
MTPVCTVARRWLVASFASALVACGSTPVEAPQGPLADDARQLYIEIGTAHAPLSECMQPLMSAELAQRAAREIDLARFRDDARSVLGAAHPVIVASADESADRAQRVQQLVIALAGYNATLGEDPPIALKLRGAKALSLLMIHHASFSGGRCAPSPSLLHWLEQVPRADQ